jgi:methyl-accepting chemotaxis protein
MNIRSKVILSIMVGVITTALIVLEVALSGTKSIVAVAAIVLAFCAAAVVVGMFIADSIVVPLDAIAGMIREMSHGYFGWRLNLKRNDEIGSMAKVLDTLADNIAESADQAKLSAAEANVDAHVGSAAMTRMAEAVNRIKASSDNNAKIIKRINYIAMRARCLAFNASIEAARAGEAGKEFASVADDVRSFAARCAESVKSITDMIEESEKDVDDGVKITEDAVRAIGKIVDRIDGKIDRKALERADTASDTIQHAGGDKICAAGQGGRLSISERQKRYSDFPYKGIYSAAPLTLWTPMNGSGADAGDNIYSIGNMNIYR